MGFCIYSLLFCSFVSVYGQNKSENKKQISPFRYIIAHNEINKLSKKSNVLHRNLIVLMEKDAFTEENLKKLYILVTKRFPKPLSLIVIVETDINEIPTLEERETGTFGLSKSKKRSWAIMFRSKNVSRIDISSDSKDLSIEMPKQ